MMTREDVLKDLEYIADFDDLSMYAKRAIGKISAHDQAQRAVIEEARRTAEYWKAEHLAGNEKIEQQAKRIQELEEWQKKLEEWQQIVIGAGTDPYTITRMAATEYTQVAIQSWKEKREQQAKEIGKLKSEVFLAQEAYEMTLQREKKQVEQNQALREALQDVLLDLQIILPMAKGYAHEHPVGNNKDKVYGVDAVIEQAQQALKEVS